MPSRAPICLFPSPRARCSSTACSRGVRLSPGRRGLATHATQHRRRRERREQRTAARDYAHRREHVRARCALEQVAGRSRFHRRDDSLVGIENREHDHAHAARSQREGTQHADAVEIGASRGRAKERPDPRRSSARPRRHRWPASRRSRSRAASRALPRDRRERPGDRRRRRRESRRVSRGCSPASPSARALPNGDRHRTSIAVPASGALSTVSDAAEQSRSLLHADETEAIARDLRWIEPSPVVLDPQADLGLGPRQAHGDLPRPAWRMRSRLPAARRDRAPADGRRQSGQSTASDRHVTSAHLRRSRRASVPMDSSASLQRPTLERRLAKIEHRSTRFVERRAGEHERAPHRRVESRVIGALRWRVSPPPRVAS